MIHTSVFEFPLSEFCKRYVSCPRSRVKIIIAMTYDASVEWRRSQGVFIMTMVAAVITMANQLMGQQEQARHQIPGNWPCANATRSSTIVNRAQVLGRGELPVRRDTASVKDQTSDGLSQNEEEMKLKAKRTRTATNSAKTARNRRG